MMSPQDWRERHRRLDADDPGAPPGFLLDPKDQRTGSHTQGDQTGCAEEVPRRLWDKDGDPLARGEGEES
jgi:hypothetical protein